MTQLPLLFLPDVVVLPGMVVPIELDEAAQAAVDAARASSDGRAAGGAPARGPLRVVRRGRHHRAGRPVQPAAARPRCSGPAPRPRSAAASPGPVPRCGSRSSPVDERRHRARPRARRGVQAARRRRAPAPRGLADHRHRRTDDRPRARSPTRPATRRTSPTTASASCSRPRTSSSGSSPLIEWTRDHLAEVEVNDKIGEDVREGMEKTPARVPAAPAARRDPQGARRGRARRRRRLPRPGRGGRPARRRSARPRCARSTSSSAPATRAPRRRWIRTWLDTVLELPWNATTEDSTDVAAARAVLDADHHGLDEVKDRIVEYLAVRARRAERGLRGRRRPRLRRRDPAGRPSRRRQDLARRVRRARARAASSSASPSAACATRRRSAATGARTSARCPAASSARSRRPAR